MTDAEVALAEQLVLDAEDAAPLDGEVTATQQAHRLAAGGAVERLGDRRPPVDDDGLRVLVGDGQPADVEALHPARLLGAAIDATEDQRRVAEVELVESLDEGLVEGVALEAGLHRAAEAGFVEVSQPPRRRLRRLQAVVGEIDVRLLGFQFGMLLGQTFPSTVERVENWGFAMLAAEVPGPDGGHSWRRAAVDRRLLGPSPRRCHTGRWSAAR